MALLTSYWLADIFIFIAACVGALYAFFKHKFQTWQKRGFPVPLEPSFPFGNFSGVNQRLPMDLIAAEIYKETEGEKIVGCYVLASPVAIIRDLDIAKNILIKDFGHFHDRLSIQIDPKKDPLGQHLFIMGGQPWRNLRIKLTPTFTSGKMKFMFPPIVQISDELVNILGEKCSEEMDIKDIFARYSTDVISMVAFGIETNSLRNPKAEFRKYGQQVAKPTFKQMIMNLMFFSFPKLAAKLPIRFLDKDVSDFFMNAIQQNIDYRVENKIHRNDFFQLLLELLTLGYVKDADNREKSLEDQQKFTVEQMASQAFLFFFAGFETSSATMLFAVYELALNPDLQKQVQQEIQEELAKNGGNLTYEAMMAMELLDRIVSETLRKYPPASFLIRECNKEYDIPGTNLKFLPGDQMWLSLYGYHHDPKNYPNPEKFDPDRFLPEAKESRHSQAYMPFGDGPRNCIGNRFGLMQIKAGLAMIFSNFDLEPTEGTPIPIQFDPKAQILTPKGNLQIKFTKRK